MKQNDLMGLYTSSTRERVEPCLPPLGGVHTGVIPSPHEITTAICRRYERRPADGSGVERKMRWNGYKLRPRAPRSVVGIGMVLGLLGLGFVMGFLGPAAQAEDAPSLPNIIFILADDLGMGDLGCYGQKHIQTPCLDRLAAEGIRFTQGYSGASVCAPSRATLMTGLSTGHCPIRANREIGAEGQRPLPEGTVTVASILKSKGYATGCFGKWGMGMFDTTGSPLRMGFDRFVGYNCQRHAHHYFAKYLYENDQRVELDGTVHSADWIGERALAWIEANARSQRPFFLFYATTMPHTYHEVTTLGEYEHTDWTDAQKHYAALVTRLDTEVGRVVECLEKNGIDRNTLIVFSGDNGGDFQPGSENEKFFNQSLGLRGWKRSVYEGGLRNACLAWWRGKIQPGQVCDVPWVLYDFLPTCVELTGAELPSGFQPDGKSITPLLWSGDAGAHLTDPSLLPRDAFYWELHEGTPIQAVRFGDWKAVRNGPNKALELYDLSVDWQERRDISAGNPDVVSRAEVLLRTMRTDVPQWHITAPQ